MGELPRFTAALERQWPSGGVGPATLPKWTIICTGACIALNTLLLLLHRKEMSLPDDGWTRLVAAAGKRAVQLMPARPPIAATPSTLSL